jgi:type IV pilus assembly protein PilA
MLKPELQAKFLQHLNGKKKGDEGFTLIELLVVVIIIGILAAIALPSLLGQVNKAKQAEAKQNVGTVNRSQQAYYLEYQNFAEDLGKLQVGIKSQTENFKYTIDGGGTGVAYAQVKAEIAPGKKALKTYFGVVGTKVGNAATSEALTIALACESKIPDQAVTANYTSAEDCGSTFNSLAR